MKQKKQILFCCTAYLAILFVCLLFPLPARAETPELGGDYVYRYSGQYQGYEIVKYRGTSLRVEVPGNINGIPVTSVAKEAFCGSDIVEAVLPESVAAIGEKAFFGCGRLRNAVLPENLQALGEAAFESCSRLKTINLPDGLTVLSDDMFQFCVRLEEIEIPKNITRIGAGVFVGSGLKRITFSEDSALKEIGEYAFEGCRYLEEIRFPDSLQEIDRYAFFKCFRMKKALFGADSQLERLGTSCFFFCSALKTFTVPKHVKEMVEPFPTSLRKIIFKGKVPKGLAGICFSAHPKTIFKVPAKYRARYKKALKKSKYFKKTMRIQ